MMMTHNEDVSEQKANGTCSTLEQVLLKPNEETFSVMLESGVEVRAVYASQVECIVLRHQTKGMTDRLFKMKSDVHRVSAKWPMPKSLQTSNKRDEMIPMVIHQFPIVRNSCTTGHKLQGKTEENIFIYEWHYGTNWPYVVLSRVTTMAGVFIREDLDEDVSKYCIPEELNYLLSSLRDLEPAYNGIEEYDEIANDNYSRHSFPSLISP